MISKRNTPKNHTAGGLMSEPPNDRLSWDTRGWPKNASQGSHDIVVWKAPGTSLAEARVYGGNWELRYKRERRRFRRFVQSVTAARDWMDANYGKDA
jgi:hypothetical protein